MSTLIQAASPEQLTGIFGSRFESPIATVAVDSRKVVAGSLFFALSGNRSDGHAFLEEAAERGATAAVVNSAYRGAAFGMTLLPVADGLEALQQLMVALLNTRGAKRVVGITGSLGKTTVKGFIAQLLSQRYRVFTPSGNHNSQVGLPIAILNEMRGDEELLVIEMAMSEAGNISRLVEMVPPDIGLITAIELVHACNFDGIEGIARAKGEIFSNSKTALGLMPQQIRCRDLLDTMGACHKRYFVEEHPLATSFAISGAHNRMLAAAAIEVALECGVEAASIAAAMPTLTLPRQRLQRVEKRGVVFINDSYNAAEASVKVALDVLPPPREGGQRIAIIGQMLELGMHSTSCHRAVGEHALTRVDTMLCIGKETGPIIDVWKQQGRSARAFSSHAALLQALKRIAQPGDVVLVKGARSMALETIIDNF